MMPAKPKSEILSQVVRRARLDASPDAPSEPSTDLGQDQHTVSVTKQIEVTAPL